MASPILRDGGRPEGAATFDIHYVQGYRFARDQLADMPARVLRAARDNFEQQQRESEPNSPLNKAASGALAYINKALKED